MIYGRVEGEGTPFIFIHGYLGMSDNWKSFGTEMANRGFQSHLIDMRNHGRSFHSMEFSYEIMADDVKGYCDANDLKNIVLLGHSMGGKVAMLFATKYPEYIKKINCSRYCTKILCSSSSGNYESIECSAIL